MPDSEPKPTLNDSKLPHRCAHLALSRHHPHKYLLLGPCLRSDSGVSYRDNTRPTSFGMVHIGASRNLSALWLLYICNIPCKELATSHMPSRLVTLLVFNPLVVRKSHIVNYIFWGQLWAHGWQPKNWTYEERYDLHYRLHTFAMVMTSLLVGDPCW